MLNEIMQMLCGKGLAQSEFVNSNKMIVEMFVR